MFGERLLVNQSIKSENSSDQMLSQSIGGLHQKVMNSCLVLFLSLSR